MQLQSKDNREREREADEIIVDGKKPMDLDEK
jgi:hypothetical protein